jgi:hypothetical protein
MKPAAALALALSVLAATCETRPEQSVVTATAPSTTVETPIAVACIRPEDIPELPPSAMPDKSADVARKAAGASADLRDLRTKFLQMRALLIGCAAMTKEHQP